MPSNPKTTSRAYTLRLRGTKLDDESWRSALWSTHEAVNKGARVFGDWLLTMRGGLDHALADGKNNLTNEQIKARRILLALSWLSVESKLGAPEEFIIASGKDKPEDRNKKVITAFEEILKRRDVSKSEIAIWKKDCSASLSAAIREDAVWVNRSEAFDKAVNRIGSSLSREKTWDLLNCFFINSEEYLAPKKSSNDEEKGLVKQAGQWLSCRFGSGKGAEFSRMACVYDKIAEWADKTKGGTTGKDAIYELACALVEFAPASEDIEGVLGLLSGPGYKSATRNFLKQLVEKADVTRKDFEVLKEKAEKDAQKCRGKINAKGQHPYSDAILNDVESACGFTYRVGRDNQPVPVEAYSKYGNDFHWGAARHSQFAVMLDHAARRVSTAHTWIKCAEAERSRFEEDANKIDRIPKSAKDWLDRHCSKRSETSGAAESYRICRRAVNGWKEVVAEWSNIDCKSTEDRIAAARALQDDQEIDKFGDIQLFEALAEDDALCVWHKNGDPANEPDPGPLIDYALATEAEFKKRHFKVPAYCHPDALRHPIFCDFGESRWDISYGVHKKSQTPSLHQLFMTLWNGHKMEKVEMRWQSKRLTCDLALWNTKNEGTPAVSRADRLGRAASNVNKSDVVSIAGLFQQKTWNGRLQAPRKQLEAIASVWEKENLNEQERKRRISGIKDHIHWFLTFSANLLPQGPWYEYAEQHSINPTSVPNATENKNRKGHARILLSRLPALRVLSVDLGHRSAAACAVWETVTAKQVAEACQAAGQEAPKDSDLFLHLRRKATKQKKGKPVMVEQTTLYRRIGADTLPDGKLHPAPWARLDRQFLIKLQGEEEMAREASNNEIWKVHQMEVELGLRTPLIDRLVISGWGKTEKQQARIREFKNLGWEPAEKAEGNKESGAEEEALSFRPSLSVDELMSSAVRTMRLGLKRHSDRARIANYLITDVKTKPGGGKELMSEDERINLIQNALVMWHDLFSSSRWRDHSAKQLWDKYLTKLSGFKTPEKISEDLSLSERRKEQEDNREELEKFREVAKALVKDADLRKILHESWKKRWEADDKRWKNQLRWFKDWILPSGKAAENPAICKVGGLSLTRIATLTEFRRKVQVGFFSRLQPNGESTISKEQFGQSTLDALERLREQRVKQLASRIVEAALGVGRIQRPSRGKDRKRPDVRVDEPCHAIVIEDLTHYRPDETRTRRENRQLMVWSSSKVKKFLEDACHLHGLYLLEVQAGYTSRQDSRTGAPGIRCQDVPIEEFMRSLFWRKQVRQAEARQAENKGDARDRYLCDLNSKWKDKTAADWVKTGVVRVPLNGGEVFVSADPNSPAAKGLQADLNAAANIGLRALIDPDWPGKWWYVPCDPASFKPLPDKTKGSVSIDLNMPLKVTSTAGKNTTGKKSGKAASKPKEVVNLWQDISSKEISKRDTAWEIYPVYQKTVQNRVIDILRAAAFPN